MSLSAILKISGSAMSAQAKRMNVIASNIANAESVTGPDGQPYRAKRVVFKPMSFVGVANSGVQVERIVEDRSPPKMVYDPKHPLADANGYVAMPNVKDINEMTDMLSCSNSYLISVEVANSAKELEKKTMTIGQ